MKRHLFNQCCKFVALAAVLVATSLRAQTVFNWAGADGDWDASGIWSGSSFINNAPVSFIADANGSTITVKDNTELRIGQVITNAAKNVRAISSNLGEGKYQVDGALTAGTDVSFIAHTEIGVRFSSAGVTTVSGNKYLNQLTTNSFIGTRTISGDGANSTALYITNNTSAVKLTGAGSMVFDSMTVSNGKLNYDANLILGNEGSGTLTFKNSTLYATDGVKFVGNVGSLTVLDNVVIGSPNATKWLNFGKGTYSLVGSNTATSNGQLQVGNDDVVNMVIESGGVLKGVGAVNLGRKSGVMSTLEVKGELATNAGDLNVGAANGAKGTLTVSGTGNVILPANSKYLYINAYHGSDNSAGIVNISGGTLATTGVVFGANSDRSTTVSSTAQLNITGGVLALTSGNGIHTGAFGSSGENNALHTASDTQINLGGGTISSVASWTLGMNATLTGSNGNIKFRTNGTTTINSQLSGAGGLQVETGTLLINGTAGGTVHTYKGQTIVDNGATLQLGNLAELTISLADLGGLAVFDGAGALTINGKVTISDDLTVFGSNYQLMGAGLLGALTISNDNWLTGFTKSGNQWLYDNDNSIFFDKTTGILTLSQIPEPSTGALLLIGGGLLAVGFFRRKK